VDSRVRSRHGAAGRSTVAFSGCRSKLAEILEKILKAELIRTGWTLEKLTI
jgi:hypothetical protein